MTRQVKANVGRAWKVIGLSFPMTVMIQEANDLAQICEEPSVRARLRAVGISAARLAELRLQIAEVQAAEFAWIVARRRGPHPEELALLTRARGLLAECRAVMSCHLRGTSEEKELRRLERGRSSLATAHALNEYAGLLRESAARFRGDGSFDALRVAGAAAELWKALLDHEGHLHRKRALELAKGDRDVAFTALKELTCEVRAAARYAFRDDPNAARRFASPYRRTMRRAGRERAPSNGGRCPPYSSYRESSREVREGSATNRL